MQHSKGIYFEFKRVLGGTVPYQHAYLVYRDGKGGERVIRGGITDNFDGNPGGAVLNTALIPRGGDISVQVDIPLQESKDKYGDGASAESRHARKLDLGGRERA